MTTEAIAESLELADYRRRVAELYVEVRRRGVDRASWHDWCLARNELLSTHPQSPVDPDLWDGARPVDYFAYDPSWRVIAAVEPFDGPPPVASVAEGTSTFAPIGTAVFERAGVEHRLGLFWLQAYGGGLFLPFGDETNGTKTYGGGRYLLDGAKSADLGGPARGRLLCDFNFAYHPSCAWNARWPCPLAPPGNRLAVAVEAGERLAGDGEPG